MYPAHVIVLNLATGFRIQRMNNGSTLLRLLPIKIEDLWDNIGRDKRSVTCVN